MTKTCRRIAPRLSLEQQAAVILVSNAMQHLLDRQAELTEDGTHALHLMAKAIGAIAGAKPAPAKPCPYCAGIGEIIGETLRGTCPPCGGTGRSADLDMQDQHPRAIDIFSLPEASDRIRGVQGRAIGGLPELNS